MILSLDIEEKGEDLLGDSCANRQVLGMNKNNYSLAWIIASQTQYKGTLYFLKKNGGYV